MKDNNNIYKEKISNESLLVKDLTKDSYPYYQINNTFIAFTSINDILYLIYANNKYSIISFDLIDNKKIIEIKKAHKSYITNFRHFLDTNNKRDLIISISSETNNIKLWDTSNFCCLYNYENINQSGEIYSACFLNDMNQNFIITSNSNILNTENLKIYNFCGNKIKEINDSNYNTFFVDTYYDIKKSKIFLITGNFGYIKSYDYYKNSFYSKYLDDCNKYKNEYSQIIIHDKDEIVKLLVASKDKYIRIWDFHSSLLLKKLNINNMGLNGIYLWNNHYLFVGCNDKNIYLLELKTGKILHILKGHYKEVLNIKKINHPNFGECLITQGFGHDIIKLWNIKYILKEPIS